MNYIAVRIKVVGVDKDKETSNNFWNMDKDAKITFEQEPTNEYDKKAIKVLANGKHIGYVNRFLTLNDRADNGDPYNYVNGFIWITNEELNNYINNNQNIDIIRHKMIQYHKTVYGLEVDMKVTKMNSRQSRLIKIAAYWAIFMKLRENDALTRVQDGDWIMKIIEQNPILKEVNLDLLKGYYTYEEVDKLIANSSRLHKEVYRVLK